MGFPVRSSENLVDWKEHGLAFAAKDAKWGVKCFWAPECYELNGRYYLFYSADWKENPAGALENFRIGVAVSDRPDGGFQDIGNQPIFDPGYPIIDADVYREAGRFYLYYSRCCYEHEIDGLEESRIFRASSANPCFCLDPNRSGKGVLRRRQADAGMKARICSNTMEGIS